MGKTVLYQFENDYRAIDVLVTWEDIAPEPIERFNDTSTVLITLKRIRKNTSG